MNYSDTLIRALGKVVLYVWVCKVLVNMYCNNALQRKEPRPLCVSVCVRPLFDMKASETEG